MTVIFGIKEPQITAASDDHKGNFIRTLRKYFMAALFLVPVVAIGALPAVQPPIRYLSLGDSLAAGYKAQPATMGFSYQLYLDRVFGSIPDVIFANAAVPGATSLDVLNDQVPEAYMFQPTVITLSVGGNDLLTLLSPNPPPIQDVLNHFYTNLSYILTALCKSLPDNGNIYLNNLYTVPEIPGADIAVPEFNLVIDSVVTSVEQSQECHHRTIRIAEVNSAFQGQQGLLLVDRYAKKGVPDTYDVHPTNKGYQVMEDAYKAVIGN